ncbi:aqualysin-1-like [Glandiceps talaboti]
MLRAITALLFVSCAVCVPLPADVRYYPEGEAIQNSYIVVLKNNFDRDQVISDLKTQFPDVVVSRRYTILNGFAADILPKGLQYLRHVEAVEYIEQDGYVFADQSIASWGLDRVDQRNLPLDNVFVPEGDGAGVNAYIFDTGIRYDHVDFEGRAFFFFDSIGDPPAVGDCNGHGSHCAGTVGGAAHGVAKKVTLWNVRVLGCSGSGPRSGIIEALEYVRDNGVLPGVCSMSIGGSASQAYNDVVDSVVQAGFPLAASAGNDGRTHGDSCVKSPASAELAMATGATDSNDIRADYSNWGPCMNIFAPGSSITSCDYQSDTATSVKSGTSMACPHVAGVAAIIYANNPTWSPSDIWDKIQEDATKDVVQDAKEAEGTPNILLYSSI